MWVKFVVVVVIVAIVMVVIAIVVVNFIIAFLVQEVLVFYSSCFLWKVHSFLLSFNYLRELYLKSKIIIDNTSKITAQIVFKLNIR